MDGQELVYVIPPYLLSTALGASLRKKLELLDPDLARNNCVAVGSDKYGVPTPKSLLNIFLLDLELNQAIKEKLIYKLAILGVAGTENPVEKLENEKYLLEMFEVFKGRLLFEEGNNDELDPSRPVDSASARRRSISLENTGETVLERSLAKYSHLTLRQLLHKTKAEETRNRNMVLSFVNIRGQPFEYPLPISWLPLVTQKNLEFLKLKLGMQIGLDNGFSNIAFSCHGGVTAPKAWNKYTNFITDKLVPYSAGVYYYEVEVEQKATAATQHQPIIVTNQESVSLVNLMHVCVGFVKRFLTVDFGNLNHQHRTNSLNSLTASRVELDFDAIKNDVDNFLYNHFNSGHGTTATEEEASDGQSALTEDYEGYLQMQPGTFSSLFAVNFEDLVFHNLEKQAELLQRAAVLNMNRRLLLGRLVVDEEAGKVDLGIPLSTYTEKEKSLTNVVSRTDVIGCGINFYDKLIFYTLNGILVKKFTKGDLTALNPSGDNLFFETDTDLTKTLEKVLNLNEDPILIADLKSVFPIIGVQVDSELKGESTDPSITKITTNLGFKEFKFNVNNYIHKHRQNYESQLESYLNDKLEDADNIMRSSLEYKFLDVEDRGMMSKLIKEYLNHEAYLELFKGFVNDLQKLDTEIKGDEAVSNALNAFQSRQILKKLQTENRQLIKQHIFKSEFDLAFKFISVNFPRLLGQEGGEIVFQMKLLKYVSLIKDYYGNPNSPSLFSKVLDYGKEIMSEYSQNKAFSEEIYKVLTLTLLDSNSYHQYPMASDYIVNYDKRLAKLAGIVNNEILKLLGFKQPTIFSIFNRIEENIDQLSLEYCDDKFALVDFERDYVDL